MALEIRNVAVLLFAQWSTLQFYAMLSSGAGRSGDLGLHFLSKSRRLYDGEPHPIAATSAATVEYVEWLESRLLLLEGRVQQLENSSTTSYISPTPAPHVIHPVVPTQPPNPIHVTPAPTPEPAANYTYIVHPVTSDCGVCCNDKNTGAGFLMYSARDVHERFTVHKSNYENFVCVRYLNGHWEQDTNSAWVTFNPEASDRLVAEVDFSEDTVSPLVGAYTDLHGIERGYSFGNLAFFANRDQRGSNVGEFLVTGSHFSTCDNDCISAVQPITSDCGVCCNDKNTGTGFLMYSARDVHERFTVQKSNYENFVCVRYLNGHWEQDSNSAWFTFNPEASDRLVAEVDFSADTVSPLVGTYADLHGIESGYSFGDLVFSANRPIGAGGHRGGENVGEFWIKGSYYSTCAL